MPGKKKMNKQKRGPASRKTGNREMIPRGPNFSGAALGLPAAKRVQMRYCETINLASTVGAMGTYEWSANDLFDPNITGAGHQPYGFDQWMTFYTKATVMKSSCVVEATTTGTPLTFGVFFSRGAAGSTISSAMSLIEAYRGTGHLCTGSSAPVRVAKSNFDLMVTDPEFDPGSFFCTTAASPTFRYHYTVFAQSADLSTTANLLGFITILYDVLLEDPVTIAAS